MIGAHTLGFRRWRRAWFVIAALAAIGAAAFAGMTVRARARNSVDILGSLNPDAAIYSSVMQASSPLEFLGRYLQSRPRPPHVAPWQVWLDQASVLDTVQERFPAGDLGGACLGPTYYWHPGAPIAWSRPTPAMLLFCFQRQAFLLELLSSPRTAADPAILNSAWAFVGEWRRANPVFPNHNLYAWGDDPVANRIQAHIELAAARRAQGLSTPDEELAFLSSVLQHAASLMDERAHNYRTNHGLMQNCALLSIALEYPEFDRGGRWLKTAVARMERHLRETVSQEGAFLELTPGYHWDATVMSLWFVASCRAAHVHLEPWVEDRVRKMLAFSRDIMQPDRTFPAIADTSDGDYPEISRWPDDLPRWPELTALRDALSPATPLPNEPAAQLVRGAGYFILRAPAPSWSPHSALMATMIAGPRSRAHEHYNALSLTLYARGRQLLNGPGYPSYSDEASRAVLIATTSQNTVSVDGQSQQGGDAAILRFENQPAPDGGPGRVICQAESRLYAGVVHRRSLYYGASKTAILLVDELTSETPHIYRQHFRVARGIPLREPSRGVLELTDASSQAPPLLTIQSWILQHGAPSSPSLAVEAPMAAFATFSPAATFVTILEFGPAGTSTRVEVAKDLITWNGAMGAFKIPLKALPQD
jgi:hypothetical protein